MTGVQLSIDSARQTALHEVTFVVFDLETTGGNSSHDAVTEIGAVKVRGGQVIGEFSTLVNPQREIPTGIVSITGISNAMVVDAPPFDGVLPSFLEFCAGSVLVAHNAAFDIGFLKANCQQLDLRWPKPPVVCTLRLARRVLLRDESPNHKLGTLARVLNARTEPNHRALTDARTTVDVLHSLLERLGPLGVHSLEDLVDHLPDVTPVQRRKSGLADALPSTPGVYLFRGPNDEVLYVGTATNLRRRVRQYFTAGERRARMKEMVGLAERVDHVECAHPMEAETRELRLLAAHQPRYNRRSKFPRRAWWVVLTDEPFPRLSIVRKPKPSAFGPFSSHKTATEAVDALQSATKLRRCTDRIPATKQDGRPCALFELGRCGAPCAGKQSTEDYAVEVVPVADVIAGRDDTLLQRLRTDLGKLAEAQRFEDAARERDRLADVVRSLDRGQRLTALARLAELVAARPDGAGGWQLAVIRHGRLAAAGTATRGVAPIPIIDLLCASAETVIAGPGPLLGASADEVQVIYRWLTTGGTRMVRCTEAWSEPAEAAGAWRHWLDLAENGRNPYAGVD